MNEKCFKNFLELQTILRDKNTSRSDFKFYADRLIRLVIEESLNQLPYSDCSVITPTGKKSFEEMKVCQMSQISSS